MTPKEILIPKMRRGDTFSGISVSNLTTRATPQDTPVPIDLTGAEIDVSFINSTRMVIKMVSIGDGITLVGTDGFVIAPFIITHTGIISFDVQFTFVDDTVRTWFKGTIEVEDDITK